MAPNFAKSSNKLYKELFNLNDKNKGKTNDKKGVKVEEDEQRSGGNAGQRRKGKKGSLSRGKLRRTLPLTWVSLGFWMSGKALKMELCISET